MKPNRYPYSGKKGHTLIKVEPELVEKVLRPRSILIDSQSLTTKLQAKDISAGDIICIDELIRGIDSYFDSVNIIGKSSLNDYGRGQHDTIFRIANVLRKIRENKEKASGDA